MKNGLLILVYYVVAMVMYIHYLAFLNHSHIHIFLINILQAKSSKISAVSMLQLFSRIFRRLIMQLIYAIALIKIDWFCFFKSNNSENNGFLSTKLDIILTFIIWPFWTEFAEETKIYKCARLWVTDVKDCINIEKETKFNNFVPPGLYRRLRFHWTIPKPKEDFSFVKISWVQRILFFVSSVTLRSFTISFLFGQEFVTLSRDFSESK